MDTSQLQAIGIDKTEAELMMKVKKATKGKQANSFQDIYKICVESDLFTKEELLRLQGKDVKRESFLDVLGKLIKKLFKV